MTYHNDQSVLAVIDVDLQIGPKFLRNCMTYPFPNGSAYFPIMFSAYDPDSVELVDQFMPKIKHNTFSDHHGIWRKFSFGMYVIAGSDASYLSMDENFVGWYVL
jgi:chondroitin sulfate synthase